MARSRHARSWIAAWLMTGLVLAGCGTPPPEASGGGFALSADQLEPPPLPEAVDDEARWEIEVATTTGPLIAAYRSPPHDSGVVAEDRTDEQVVGLVTAERAAGQTLGTPNVALTPIPSARLNWGSFLIEGGWGFANPTPSGNPRVFLVTENHGDWLRVMLPTRPNQQEGWIRTADVTLSTHRYHVEIDVTAHSLRVWNGNELVAETLVVVGKDATPTPLGRFYFNEMQAQNPNGVYGPWIMSTNGFSDSLERFSGEVPIFAVHGTSNPGAVGSNISNGCVRIPNDVIQTMAETVPMGTPIDIVA